LNVYADIGGLKDGLELVLYLFTFIFLKPIEDLGRLEAFQDIQNEHDVEINYCIDYFKLQIQRIICCCNNLLIEKV
jgi:hypothetical protein